MQGRHTLDIDIPLGIDVLRINTLDIATTDIATPIDTPCLLYTSPSPRD